MIFTCSVKSTNNIMLVDSGLYYETFRKNKEFPGTLKLSVFYNARNFKAK